MLVLLVSAPPRPPAEQQAADRPLAALRCDDELLPQLVGDARPRPVGVRALLDLYAPLQGCRKMLLEVVERGGLLFGAGGLFGRAAAVAGLLWSRAAVWVVFGVFWVGGVAFNKRRRGKREILSHQLVFPVVLIVTVFTWRAGLLH